MESEANAWLEGAKLRKLGRAACKTVSRVKAPIIRRFRSFERQNFSFALREREG
jgi:hypothetical protein